MKKVISTALILCLCFSMMIGCSSSSPGSSSPASPSPSASGAAGSNDDYFIGLSIDDMSADFCASIAEGVTAECEALGIKLQITDAAMDASLQASQVENMIAAGADVILLKPYDASSNGPISEACTSANIPLISITCPISSKYTAFIGADDALLGEFMAQSIIDAMGRTDFKVALILGPLAQENLTIVMDSAKAYFEGKGVKIADAQTGENKLDDSMQLVENWISSGLEFDAIMASSDASAKGASQALEDAGKREGIIVTGLGADAEGCDAVKNGIIDLSVWLAGATFGKMGVDAALELMKGNTIAEATLIELNLVTKDNADEFYDKTDVETHTA